MSQNETKEISSSDDPERLFTTGLHHLKLRRIKEATGYFKQALKKFPDEPRYLSYLGLCVAIQDNKATEALVLCECAVEEEFYRPELYNNLGKVHMLLGNRRKAYKAFIKGLSLDSKNKEIQLEMEKMGLRKKPVFPFLSRNNVMNKYTGKLLSVFRFR
jgi:tetratricopeptide (TPR) repeat protein